MPSRKNKIYFVKNDNEAKDVLDDSRKRYRARGQR